MTALCRWLVNRVVPAAALFALLAATTQPALAQSVEPEFNAPSYGEASQARPSRLADTAKLQPAAVLGSAMVGAHDEIEALATWNRAGKLPLRNGFSRSLPAMIELGVETGMAGMAPLARPGTLAEIDANGTTTWTTRVQVEGAYRLRLLLNGVHLPESAQLWVYAEDGETAGPFGRERVSEAGELWTPSVAGPTVTLEMRTAQDGRAAADPPRFSVSKVLELLELDASGTPKSLAAPANESCLKDGRCINTSTLDVINDYRKAVAYIEYVKGGSGFSCTGGLLNDKEPGTFVPYFLTANHCIDSQAVANTLDAFWDFFSSTCNGPGPSLGSLPKSHGATLLATQTSSDFTLLRLNSIPSGRVLLGWNANASAVPNNTIIHRLSHPLGHVQSYSQTKIDTTPAGTCTGIPTSNYIYSFKQQGATFPGSSGSPVILPGGFVVGQLRGACAHSNVNEPCLFDSQDYFIDGRFSVTFPFIDEYINAVLDTSPCFRNATTACLVGNRFEVKVTYQNNSGSGAAQVMSFGGQRAENDETVFWFFTNATNFEMGVKVLNACVLNNKFWAFIGGLTDQGWTVTVRDTVSGVTKTYSNVNGHLTETVADTAAISCP